MLIKEAPIYLTFRGLIKLKSEKSSDYTVKQQVVS